MTVNFNRFYLGYPGNMQMLPGLTKGSNPVANPLLQGNPFVGLNGTMTLDRLSIKKNWQLAWDYLTEAQFAPIDAIYHTMMAGKPRLMDLRHTNLLNRQLSSGGSYKRGTSGFSVPTVPINSNTNFEAGISPWTCTNGSLTQSATLAHTGGFSGRIVPTNASGIGSETLTVTAGVNYTASGWLWFTSAAVASVGIAWLTAGSALISTTTVTLPLVAGIWSPIAMTATAPPTAAKAVLQFGNTGAATTNIWYADDVSMVVAITPPAFQTYTDLPAPLPGQIDGGIGWFPTASGQNLQSAYDEMPVIAGSQYLFSAYTKAASGTVSLVLQPYDVNGAALSPSVTSAVTQTGVWQRLLAPSYTPPSGAVTFAVGIQSTGIAVQLNTTGWQLQIDPPTGLAAWVPGWGVPKIILPELDVLYPYPGWVRAKLFVQEA